MTKVDLDVRVGLGCHVFQEYPAHHACLSHLQTLHRDDLSVQAVQTDQATHQDRPLPCLHGFPKQYTNIYLLIYLQLQDMVGLMIIK